MARSHGGAIELALAIDAAGSGSPESRERFIDELMTALDVSGIDIKTKQNPESDPRWKGSGTEMLILSLVSGLIPSAAQIVASFMLSRREKAPTIYLLVGQNKRKLLEGRSAEDIASLFREQSSNEE